MTVSRFFQKNSSLRKFMTKPEFSSLVLMVLMILVTAVLQDNFFRPKSMIRNLNAFAPLILMTMGQAVVIISGGLDLSAGSALSLMTCILTYVMKRDMPLTGVTAIIITLAAAVVIGIINGIGIGYLRIPPVIVTFATSFMWLGIALFIRPTPGGEAVDWFRVFYNPAQSDTLPQFIRSMGSVLPPSLMLVLAGCLIWFIISRTAVGKYIYAVGSRSESAYESGINTAWVQTQACIINSMFIFLAALFFVAQNQSGDARMGDPLTLRAIAAAVVGGIALTGGRGNVYFGLVGALILSFVNKIIFFANIPYAYQTLVSGFIIIAAIASSQIYSAYNRRAGLKEKKLT